MAKINFDKLTKPQQRVVIAKDLIARLNQKKFKAQQATYLRIRGFNRAEFDEDTELRDALKGADCRGCQIGGFFLCAVDRHNKLALKDVYDIGDHMLMREYLDRWFTDKQLLDAEEAFEGGYGDSGWANKTADERMRAIAQNIIKNKGQLRIRQLFREG